jgi:Domain of unknown function (DUF4386)
MLELVTAVVLVAVPILFNLAFLALGRAFDYPGILRESPDIILRRFHAGGPGLIVRWQALLWSAAALLPLVILLAAVLDAPPALTLGSVLVGGAAAIVQMLGLARWPFLVPELARRYVAAPEGPAGEATREAIRVTFAAVHRLFGVGIGEHLGYLLTGAWTLLVAMSVASTAVLPAWLGLIGVPIGIGILVGALEFVGPNEPGGWAVAGAIVPIAYIAWSIWLLGLGVALAFV